MLIMKEAFICIKKLGFEVEGIRRNAAFRDGKYCDVVMMAQLKNIE